MIPRPTRTAVGLVAGAVALYATGTNVQAGWVLAVSALLGGVAVVGAVAPMWALRGVTVERTAPRRARAGEPVEVTVTVRNASRGLRGAVTVRDAYLGEAAFVVPLLRPGQARTWRSVRTGARRGVHTGGSVTLSSAAPLGVASVRHRIEAQSPIVVHPRLFPVAWHGLMGRAAAAARAVDGDIATVREHRPADPLRLVHWRSTARRGELVVREFEDHARSEITVVAHVPGPDPDLADTVAEVACSLAVAAMASGDEVYVVRGEAGGPSRVRVSSSDAVGDWGARLGPAGDPVGVVDAAGPQGAVVAVLGLSSETAAAVQRLAGAAVAGRDVVCVIVHDDDPQAAAFAAKGLGPAGARVITVPVSEEPARCFRVRDAS